MEYESFPPLASHVAPALERHWRYVFKHLREHLVVLVDAKKPQRPLGIGLAFPFVLGDRALSDEGLTWMVELAVQCHADGLVPDCYGVGGISIAPKHRGRGLAEVILGHFKEQAVAMGLRALVIAVRPTMKGAYPLVEQSEYARWVLRRDPLLPFDPWLRLHVKNGGVIVGTCAQSLVIEASVKQFEELTGLECHGSGNYVFPGCVAPATVDVDRNRVLYVEEDVWVQYKL